MTPKLQLVFVAFSLLLPFPGQNGPMGSTSNIIHEIGPALGLYHEQSRADRDSHATIVTIPDGISTGERSGLSTVDTGAGRPWTASTKASRLKLDRSSGSGPAVIKVSVARNNGKKGRGDVVVAGGFTVAVNQSGR